MRYLDSNRRPASGKQRRGPLAFLAICALSVVVTVAAAERPLGSEASGSVHATPSPGTSSIAAPAPSASPMPSPGSALVLSGPATTLAALTLRAAPSAASAPTLVMPAGARVTLTGQARQGFVSVSYQGKSGWAASPYLDKSAGNGQEHWIDVARRAGTVTLYAGNKALAIFRGYMSADQSDDGFYATAPGRYTVYAMNADLTYTDYGGVYIRDWVGFDPDRANGFHSYPMDAAGRVLPDAAGPSHGCVRLAPADADTVYAFAYLGMRVVVHW